MYNYIKQILIIVAQGGNLISRQLFWYGYARVSVWNFEKYSQQQLANESASVFSINYFCLFMYVAQPTGIVDCWVE